MTSNTQEEVLLQIQQLIDKSRCSIDGFFTDSKAAAIDILKYLEAEKIISRSESVKIAYKETNRAA